MKKFYKKVPEHILEKISRMGEDTFIVSVARQISEEQFTEPLLSKFKFAITDDQLSFESPFLPPANCGKSSKRNVEGYHVIRKDLPKVDKTYYLGERPKWGDWANGSFSLYVTKKVYQREFYHPKELEIILQKIDQTEMDGKKLFAVTFTISQVLNRTDPNYQDLLLFDINLLQENVGIVDVFPSSSLAADYLTELQVNWDIFPPGERDVDLIRISSGLRNVTPEVKERIQERYDFLKQFNPIQIIKGMNGMARYFGMQFTQDVVVFENMYTGNAIYFLYDDWESTSKLSRTEIMALPESMFLRIKHTKYWKERLTAELRKLNLPPQQAA